MCRAGRISQKGYRADVLNTKLTSIHTHRTVLNLWHRFYTYCTDTIDNSFLKQ